MLSQVVLICCATLLLVVLDTNVVNADCCPAHSDFVRFASVPGKCDDGTEGTPYCGYGPCNIFGCNCDGGCRHGNRDARISDDILSTNKGSEGSHMDTNRDGLVDREEAIRFLRMAGVQSPESKVSRSDKNGDGYLSNEEINAVSVE